MSSPDTLDFDFNAFADPGNRSHFALRFSEWLEIEAFLILLRDEVTGRFCPAPGFPNTLPGHPGWRQLLDRCSTPGEFECDVAFPSANRIVRARVQAKEDGTATVLIGGQPRIQWAGLNKALPLLIALLKAESTAISARGHAEAAGEASRRATHLAAALDRARAALSAKAAELRDLNATLEQRVANEIGERMKTEHALRQAIKMEAVGQLTGGVAHDFNNLLTVILGGLDTIERLMPALPESTELARIKRSQHMAKHAAQRAATLTSRLLAFSRRQPLDPKPIDANRLISTMADMLRSTLGEHINIEAVAYGGLWLAFADPAELESAIANLAINARDAMPNGGKLTIETGNAWLDEDYLAQVPELVPPGQYVLIAITDTGTGMDRATLERVFEPFFTTKSPGKGTGLGLSQVYGFVRQSGGHIRIYSEPGQGTCAKVYLPRAKTNEEADAVNRDTPALSALTGRETILVVEDHDDLRAYAAGVLCDLGYKVIEATDGNKAVAIVKSRRDLQLLFTDVVLPNGLSGKDLAEAAVRLCPRLKVLYTTGYTRNAIVHHGRLDPGVHLLNKPYSADALAKKVRRILDSP